MECPKCKMFNVPAENCVRCSAPLRSKARCKMSNFTNLMLAVANLEHNPTADELSEAVHAFGQMVADLVDKPCRLAVIVGDELETVEALQRENAKMATELMLLKLEPSYETLKAGWLVLNADPDEAEAMRRPWHAMLAKQLERPQ